MLHWVTRLAAVLFAGATLACYLAEWHWFFDLFTHFRVQYVGGAALLAGTTLIIGRRGLALLTVALALPHLWAVQDHYSSRAAAAPSAATTGHFSLTSFNAYRFNRDPQVVIDHVLRQRPDVLVLLETMGEWRHDLPQLAEVYPHALPPTWQQGANVILLSRFPLTPRPLTQGDFGIFDPLAAEIEFGAERLTLLALHPPYPFGGRLAQIRNDQLALIEQVARHSDGPLVVAGDLNSSPWSPYFRALTQSGGLHNAARGRGWQPTWMPHIPPLALPIDHILGNEQIAFDRFERGPKLGSDHLPITARIRILP